MYNIVNKREKTLKRRGQGEFTFVEYEVGGMKHSFILISEHDNVIFHTDKSLIDKLIEDEDSDMFLNEEAWIGVKEYTKHEKECI